MLRVDASAIDYDDYDGTTVAPLALRSVAAARSTFCADSRRGPPFSTTMLSDLSFSPVFRLLLMPSCRQQNFHRVDRFAFD